MSLSGTNPTDNNLTMKYKFTVKYGTSHFILLDLTPNGTPFSTKSIGNGISHFVRLELYMLGFVLSVQLS